MAWVRGHSGVTGNEVVDGMAKENTVAVQLSSPALARTGREIKKEIKQIADCKWRQWWQTIPQCGGGSADVSERKVAWLFSPGN